MGLFDNLVNEAESIGGKVGLSPEQVQAIANTVQANLTSSDGNPAAALEAAAAQHGVSVSTIEAMLNHGGGLQSELGSFAGSLFKAGQ
jgi:predicted xylose isomerase-like sugar epimerase